MRSRQRYLVGSVATFLLLGSLPLFGGLQEGRGEDIHFRGPVFAVSRDSLDHVVQLTIRVNQAQQNVVLTDWTDVIRGRGFRAQRNDIQLGDFVEVSGFWTTTGRIVATAVHIETQDAIELQGTVEFVSGNLVRISGIDFVIDPNTYLHLSGTSSSLSGSAVAQGTEARVRAAEDGGFWLAREIELGSRTVESESIRFSGTVIRIDGTAALYVDLGIRPVIEVFVARNANTMVEGYLKAGAFVEVEGRFPPGMDYVLAKRIAVDSNRNGNVFDDSTSDGAESSVELEGTVQQCRRAIDGSVNSFYLNQTLVRVQSQTVVQFDQGNNVENRRVQDGQPVEVEGSWLQDRSVLASKVHIRMQDPQQGNPGGDPGGPGDGGGGDDDHGGTGGGSEVVTVDLDGIITSVSRQLDNSVDSFVLDGKIVKIVSATVIQGKETQALPSSVLDVGLRVKVKGVKQADETIVAARIDVVGS